MIFSYLNQKCINFLVIKWTDQHEQNNKKMHTHTLLRSTYDVRNPTIETTIVD